MASMGTELSEIVIDTTRSSDITTGKTVFYEKIYINWVV